jgi:flagellar L-ring protein FlgH
MALNNGCWLMLTLVMAALPGRAAGHRSDLDLYLEQARARAEAPLLSPGSLFAANGPYSDLARDLRSHQMDDLVMIVVNDQASAVAKGTTASSRKSDASAAITGLYGTPPAALRLGNLLGANANSSLQGQGTTSRETTLSTTISARVVGVLPNGFLVVEGTKQIAVNSEQQKVTVRGLVRPADINATNQVTSDRLADLEIKIDGKGVVQDSIRRPNLLYRILLGVLPF